MTKCSNWNNLAFIHECSWSFINYLQIITILCDLSTIVREWLWSRICTVISYLASKFMAIQDYLRVCERLQTFPKTTNRLNYYLLHTGMSFLFNTPFASIGHRPVTQKLSNLARLINGLSMQVLTTAVLSKGSLGMRNTAGSKFNKLCWWGYWLQTHRSCQSFSL